MPRSFFVIANNSACLARTPILRASNPLNFARNYSIQKPQNIELSRKMCNDFRDFVNDNTLEKTSLVKVPFQPRLIESSANYLLEFLNKEKSSCDKSSRLLDAIDKFKEREISMIYLQNLGVDLHRGISFELEHNEYFKDARPPVLLSQHFGNILFTSSVLKLAGCAPYKLGENNSFVSVSPFFIASGGDSQMPHSDDVVQLGQTPNKISAISIMGLAGKGLVVTYQIMAKEIFNALSEKSQNILQMPIFYFSPSGKMPEDKLKRTDMFSIFNWQENNLQICYDANVSKSFYAISNADYSEQEIAKALDEVDKKVCELFANAKFMGAAVNAKEVVLLRHDNSLHGRLGEDNSRVVLGTAYGFDSKSMKPQAIEKLQSEPKSPLIS